MLQAQLLLHLVLAMLQQQPLLPAVLVMLQLLRRQQMLVS